MSPPPEAEIVRLNRPREVSFPARIVIVDVNEALPDVGLNETVTPDGTCCAERLTRKELEGAVLTCTAICAGEPRRRIMSFSLGERTIPERCVFPFDCFSIVRMGRPLVVCHDPRTDIIVTAMRIIRIADRFNATSHLFLVRI